MKKILITLASLPLLFGACKNAEKQIKDAYAVAPENRESFTENEYYFFFDCDEDYELHPDKVKKNEYSTIKEAYLAVFSEYQWKNDLLNGKYKEENLKHIEEAEKNTKSKFCVYRPKGSGYYIIFTPINPKKFNSERVRFKMYSNYIDNLSPAKKISDGADVGARLKKGIGWDTIKEKKIN